MRCPEGTQEFASDESAISPIAAFAIILMILSTFYTFYQVFAVPGIMQSYETRSFYETTTELIKLEGIAGEVALQDTQSSFSIKLGGEYPQIPFFTTPGGYSGMITTYPAEIKILGAVAVDPDIRNVWDGSEIVYKGSSILYSPSTMYSQQGDVRMEYGVVAVGKNSYFPIGGSKIIDGSSIMIQMFRGNISVSGSAVDLDLYPYSGGGRRIEITGAPIQISLKTSLPLDFWLKYFEGEPYISNITKNGDYVVITLMSGINYTLVGGIVDVESPARAKPHYLYRLSPSAVTAPATLTVEVRDTFNNPVPNVDVTFTSTNSSTVLTDGNNSGYMISTKSNPYGAASVVARSSAGGDVIVASITRPDGSTYQVAFVIVG